jgi:hypothetical protein
VKDTVERLRAVLDRAEQKARAATEGPWKVDNEAYTEAIYAADGTAVVAGGRWGGEASVFESTEDALHISSWDPNTVLRLVERDRALLGAFEESAEAHEGTPRAETVKMLRHHRMITLRVQVERAAEFWLGDT